MNLKKCYSKKTIAFFIAAQVITPLPLFSADPVLVGGQRGGPIFAGPGSYEHNTFDQTKILSLITERYSYISQQNLELVNQYVTAINSRIKEIIAKHLESTSSDGLTSLSQAADPIKLRNYLTARQEFKSNITELELSIQSIKAIGESLKNPDSEIKVEFGNIRNMAASMPQPLKNVLLEVALAPAEKTLNNIKNDINSLNFRVIMFDGSIKSIQGLNFDASKLPISLEERKRIQDEITANSGYNESEKRQLKQYAIAIKQKINAIMRTAKQEGYRLSDPKFKKNVNDSLDRIFFTKSLLRLRFGVPIGALIIKHNTEKFYLDWIKTGSTILWEDEVLFSLNNKESIIRDMRASFEISSSRSVSWTNWKGGDSILWQTVSGVSSLVTLVKGSSDEERFKTAILGLIIADVEEESVINQPGGLRLLKDRFSSRYAGNTDSKEKYKVLYNQINSTIDHFLGTESNNQDDDGFSGSSDMITEDADGIVGAVVGTLNTYQARAEVARKNRQFLAALSAEDTTTKDQLKRKKSVDTLFEGPF